MQKGLNVLVAGLEKTKRRKKACAYDKFYGALTVAEHEKPLLMRRLRRVLRGFSELDIKKRIGLSGDDGDCELDRIVGDIVEVLELQDEKLNSDVTSATDEEQRVFKLLTFDRLAMLNEGLLVGDNSKLNLRALNFLSLIILSLLGDRVPDDKTEIFSEVTGDKLITLLIPQNVIDTSAPFDAKSLILSRVVGAELEITCDANGRPCYKIAVSLIGEYLYDVRRIPQDFLWATRATTFNICL